MIDDGYAELFVCPRQRVRITTLTGQEQRAEFCKVVSLKVIAGIVFTLDGAKCGGRGEEHTDLVLRDHAPERAGIGCADRLAFVKNRRVAMCQWSINDVRVTDGPTKIRSSPK